jgi:hypothetical protein
MFRRYERWYVYLVRGGFFVLHPEQVSFCRICLGLHLPERWGSSLYFGGSYVSLPMTARPESLVWEYWTDPWVLKGNTVLLRSIWIHGGSLSPAGFSLTLQVCHILGVPLCQEFPLRRSLPYNWYRIGEILVELLQTAKPDNKIPF